MIRVNISNVKIAILPLRAEGELGGGVVAWKRRTLGSIYAR